MDVMDKAKILVHAYDLGGDPVKIANRGGDGAAMVNSIYDVVMSKLLNEIKNIEAG
jgi:hypothetical protein